jgi:hypothetical protein
MTLWNISGERHFRGQREGHDGESHKGRRFPSPLKHRPEADALERVGVQFQDTSVKTIETTEKRPVEVCSRIPLCVYISYLMDISCYSAQGEKYSSTPWAWVCCQTRCPVVVDITKVNSRLLV